MKFILIFFVFLTKLSVAQNSQLKGRVVGQQMEDLFPVIVENLRTQQQVETDTAGFYFINAAIGDTIAFECRAYTTEKRCVINTTKNLNVLLINKNSNELGSPWTKSQWKKAEIQVERYYKKLEKKAEKLGKWNYTWLMTVNGPIGLNN